MNIIKEYIEDMQGIVDKWQSLLGDRGYENIIPAISMDHNVNMLLALAIVEELEEEHPLWHSGVMGALQRANSHLSITINVDTSNWEVGVGDSSGTANIDFDAIRKQIEADPAVARHYISMTTMLMEDNPSIVGLINIRTDLINSVIAVSDIIFDDVETNITTKEEYDASIAEASDDDKKEDDDDDTATS